MTRNQRTIKAGFEVSGIGLHEGRSVSVRVIPGPPDSGVTFRRRDLPGSEPVPAQLGSVGEGERRTVLQRGPVQVHTVEHLLAALMGTQVDNVEIELDGPELPGLDGSALPWFEALMRAGFLDQKVPARSLRIDRPVSVELDGATLSAFPSSREGLHLSYVLDYRSRGMAPQFVEADVPAGDFGRELAPARTFVFAAEIEALRAAGLGRGADGGNTVVLDGKGGAVEGELRFPDEPARHKMLDLMGDLFLVGATIQGCVVATKSGHRAHHELGRRLAAELARQEAGTRAAPTTGLDVREIIGLLPHRYPFLLVDRVLEVDGDRRAVGLKNVTVNEPFFMGHFPGQPIMPGVLILEALAQLAGTLLLKRLDFSAGKLPVLWAVDKAKLRRPVVPGDQLRLEVETIKVRDRLGKVSCVAKVNDQVAAEAEMTFTVVDAA